MGNHTWARASQAQALHSETFPEKCLREEETRLLTCKSWQVLNLGFARKGNRYRLLPTELRPLLSKALRLLSDSHPPEGVAWPRCWAFGQCSRGCGTQGPSLWTIRGVSLPVGRNIPVWFQGLSLHTPLLTWSCYCKGQKMQLACLLESRPITKDCHYGSTFSLENTEGIATSWINPGLSAEINDLKKWYFPKVRYKN